MTESFYIVFVRARWHLPKVKRLTKRLPKLREGEVAVRVDADFKDDIFNPPTSPLSINNSNIIRPSVTLSQS